MDKTFYCTIISTQGGQSPEDFISPYLADPNIIFTKIFYLT